MSVLKEVFLFVLAGFCEIGGGYLIWIWLKEDKNPMLGLIGSLILILYGIVATFQTQTFGKTYAVYGGFFIILSLLWGKFVDKKEFDKPDILGVVVIMIGIAIMLYFPRNK